MKKNLIHIAVLLAACSLLLGCLTWEEVTPPVGEYEIAITIQVQEEWCVLKGTEVNGFTKYNTIVRDYCNICVSLQSNDPERTMRHEFDHCWRNAAGLDAKALNQ